MPNPSLSPDETLEVLCALCAVVMSNAPLGEQSDSQTHGLPPPETNSPRGGMSLQQYLDEVERREILSELKEVRFNRTQAARRLGISFRSMRYRMERLGIG